MSRPNLDRRRREPEIRVNMRIRADPIRVIGADGSMLGVISNREAQQLAKEAGFDLVEVNPKAEPPVCKIMDFGRHKYEEKKKAREAKLNQTKVDIKEIKLRPKTDDHDLDFKLRAARRFIESGNKVKFVVRFRGRELAHPDRARTQLVWLLENLEDIGIPDAQPAMEGRTMTMLISPKQSILQNIAHQKAIAAANRKKRDAEREAAGLAPEEEVEEENENQALEEELKARDRAMGDDDDDAEDGDEEK